MQATYNNPNRAINMHGHPPTQLHCARRCLTNNNDKALVMTVRVKSTKVEHKVAMDYNLTSNYKWTCNCPMEAKKARREEEVFTFPHSVSNSSWKGFTENSINFRPMAKSLMKQEREVTCPYLSTARIVSACKMYRTFIRLIFSGSGNYCQWMTRTGWRRSFHLTLIIVARNSQGEAFSGVFFFPGTTDATGTCTYQANNHKSPSSGGVEVKSNIRRTHCWSGWRSPPFTSLW